MIKNVSTTIQRHMAITNKGWTLRKRQILSAHNLAEKPETTYTVGKHYTEAQDIIVRSVHR